jgi:hypothetical protein
MAARSPFNRFAMAAQSIHTRFAIAVQSLCNRFAIALQSLCNRFAITQSNCFKLFSSLVLRPAFTLPLYSTTDPSRGTSIGTETSDNGTIAIAGSDHWTYVGTAKFGSGGTISNSWQTRDHANSHQRKPSLGSMPIPIPQPCPFSSSYNNNKNNSDYLTVIPPKGIASSDDDERTGIARTPSTTLYTQKDSSEESNDSLGWNMSEPSTPVLTPTLGKMYTKNQGLEYDQESGNNGSSAMSTSPVTGGISM